MAYAALGRVRRNWLHLFEVIYKEYARSTVTIQQFPIANLKRALGLSMGEAIKTQDAKDIAATSQVPRFNPSALLCGAVGTALRTRSAAANHCRPGHGVRCSDRRRRLRKLCLRLCIISATIQRMRRSMGSFSQAAAP